MKRKRGVIWRIKRRFVKWHVTRLIRKHNDFVVRNEFNRTQMNCARERLLKARIEYWEAAFKPWGDWNMFGKGCFAFDWEENAAYLYEMEEMGFFDYRKYFWKELEQTNG
jgi:hypothetical protein